MADSAASKTTPANKVLMGLLIASVIGLVIWQYQIINGKASPRGGTAAEGLTFKLANGGTVSLPDEDSEKYTLLVFWDADSERSLEEVAEAAKLAESAELDSIIQFYFVNLNEGLQEVQQAVNTVDLAGMVGYDPSGSFMDQFQIRVVPYAVLLSNTGKTLDMVEGYEEGQLKLRSRRWVSSYRTTGPSGEFKFGF